MWGLLRRSRHIAHVTTYYPRYEAECSCGEHVRSKQWQDIQMFLRWHNGGEEDD